LHHQGYPAAFKLPYTTFGYTSVVGELDLEFNSDGSIIMTAGKAGEDRMVKLWETASGRLLTKIPVIGSAILDTTFSPDGRYVAVTSARGAALYELDGTSLQTWTANQGHPISAIDYVVDGQTLACGTQQRIPSGRICDPDISLWDTISGRRKSRHSISRKTDADECTGLAVHPSGTMMVTTWSSNRIVVTDIGGQGRDATMLAEDPDAPGFTSDGATLWFASGISVCTRSFPKGDGEKTWKNSLAGAFAGALGIRCLATGRDWVLAGSSDGTVNVFPAVKGSSPQSTWSCSAEPVFSVALSPDGRRAAAGTQGGIVVLYENPRGKEINRKAAHGDSVVSIAFSSDGRLLATGSKDRTIRLWSVAAGSMQEVLTLRSPTGPIHSVRFSRDGQSLLAIIRGETAVRVWHLDRLRQSLRPMGLDWN
jgi:WD40 repeat protein